jgi:hypothetical protein
MARACGHDRVLVEQVADDLAQLGLGRQLGHRHRARAAQRRRRVHAQPVLRAQGAASGVRHVVI